jgi:hypothetical protein
MKSKGPLPCYKGPLLVSMLSQMNQVHNFPPYFPKTHYNIIFSSTPSCPFPSGCPTKILYAFFISYACCMSHPPHPPSFDHPNSVWWSATVNIRTFKCFKGPGRDDINVGIITGIELFYRQPGSLSMCLMTRCRSGEWGMAVVWPLIICMVFMCLFLLWFFLYQHIYRARILLSEV